MVVYIDNTEADSEEEAIKNFYQSCPYDIDAESIECEVEE
jgi:hypothetical protein